MNVAPKIEEAPAFKKLDSGKPMLSRVPKYALEELAKVLEYGANKYSWDNWRQCPEVRRYFDAALRHIYAASSDELIDQESGLPHLAHAAASIFFALELTREVNEEVGKP